MVQIDEQDLAFNWLYKSNIQKLNAENLNVDQFSVTEQNKELIFRIFF